MSNELPIDPDDEPDDSPYEWLQAEWLPETWDQHERIEPSRDVDRFRRTSAGAILAAGMLGLQQVLDPKKNEDPPIVVESPGEPPGPKHLEFDLDPDDPAASTVTIHPRGETQPPNEAR
ncbi:MAG TPA: hypothetical protein VJM33_09490 [Microthrixaceae bacterium]|nr:hypothetical protein [Microthrixaceae bacterium]